MAAALVGYVSMSHVRCPCLPLGRLVHTCGVQFVRGCMWQLYPHQRRLCVLFRAQYRPGQGPTLDYMANSRPSEMASAAAAAAFGNYAPAARPGGPAPARHDPRGMDMRRGPDRPPNTDSGARPYYGARDAGGGPPPQVRAPEPPRYGGRDAGPDRFGGPGVGGGGADRYGGGGRGRSTSPPRAEYYDRPAAAPRDNRFGGAHAPPPGRPGPGGDPYMPPDTRRGPPPVAGRYGEEPRRRGGDDAGAYRGGGGGGDRYAPPDRGGGGREATYSPSAAPYGARDPRQAPPPAMRAPAPRKPAVDPELVALASAFAVEASRMSSEEQRARSFPPQQQPPQAQPQPQPGRPQFYGDNPPPGNARGGFDGPAPRGRPEYGDRNRGGPPPRTWRDDAGQAPRGPPDSGAPGGRGWAGGGEQHPPYGPRGASGGPAGRFPPPPAQAPGPRPGGRRGGGSGWDEPPTAALRQEVANSMRRPGGGPPGPSAGSGSAPLLSAPLLPPPTPEALVGGGGRGRGRGRDGFRGGRGGPRAGRGGGRGGHLGRRAPRPARPLSPTRSPGGRVGRGGGGGRFDRGRDRDRGSARGGRDSRPRDRDHDDRRSHRRSPPPPTPRRKRSRSPPARKSRDKPRARSSSRVRSTPDAKTGAGGGASARARSLAARLAFQLTQEERGVHTLAARFPGLPVKREFTKLTCCWVRSTEMAGAVSLTTSVPIVVDNARAYRPASEPVWGSPSAIVPAYTAGGGRGSVADVYNVRVVAYSVADGTAPLEERIQFLTSRRSSTPMMLGGYYSHSKDGGDPRTDQTLVDTAVRCAREMAHVDLSQCTRWLRFMQVEYHRPSEVLKGVHYPEQREVTVVFVVDATPALQVHVQAAPAPADAGADAAAASGDAAGDAAAEGGDTKEGDAKSGEDAAKADAAPEAGEAKAKAKESKEAAFVPPTTPCLIVQPPPADASRDTITHRMQSLRDLLRYEARSKIHEKTFEVGAPTLPPCCCRSCCCSCGSHLLHRRPPPRSSTSLLSASVRCCNVTWQPPSPPCWSCSRRARRRRPRPR